MQRITIRNFRSLREIDIEIRDFVIFLGEQASGKSTVCKLIYFFKSLRDDYVRLLSDILQGEEDTFEAKFIMQSRQKFLQFFGAVKKVAGFEIRYEYGDGKQIWLFINEQQQIELAISDLFREKMISDYIQNLTYWPDGASSPVIVRSGVEGIFEDSSYHLFIPAGRNITVNDINQFEFFGNLRSELTRRQERPSGPHVQSFDLHILVKFLEHVQDMKRRLGGDFANFVAWLKELGRPFDEEKAQIVLNLANKILKGCYMIEQEIEKIYFANGESVLLAYASSGQQEAIRIVQDVFFMLMDVRVLFRIIEEPEAHLYPMAQKHLIEMLALNLTDNQLIITTHSPYILAVVNNLLFASHIITKDASMYDEVAEVIPPACWLDPERICVYYLKDGRCESIFARDIGMIDQNALDDISEELGVDFGVMYELYDQVSA